MQRNSLVCTEQAVNTGFEMTSAVSGGALLNYISFTHPADHTTQHRRKTVHSVTVVMVLGAGDCYLLDCYVSIVS